jgi:hypothetical protein
MSEKYVVTWDMLQIHARKLATVCCRLNSGKALLPLAAAVWYREHYWRVNWVFVMLIPFASPAMTTITSAN